MSRKCEAKWIQSRGRWQINVQQNGIRKTFTSSIPGIRGKVEAERKADRWLSDSLIDCNTRCEKLLDDYLEALKLSVGAGHHNQYKGFIERDIKPIIGTIKLKNLTENDLQLVIDTSFHDRNLSEKTLKDIRGCINNFVKYCRKRNLTHLFPEDISIPQGARKSRKTICTKEEINTLFMSELTTFRSIPVPDFFINAYRFEVLTGLRPGELIALENSDIKGDKLTVRRSINVHNEETQGKNNNAFRTIILDKYALAVLACQSKMLEDKGLKSKFVFPDVHMGHVQEQHYRRRWQIYCKYNGITHANTPYEMRHTWVSINAEMPSALKKMIIGHSESMDTDGTYGHKKAGDLEKASSYVSSAFDEILKGDLIEKVHASEVHT